MGYDFERSMDDVVDVVRRAKEQDGAVILLGAGCSKTAGIPLASDFRAIIEKRFPLDYARAARRKETGYQQLMAEISAGERRDLLAEYIDKAKLNWAHIALAELIKGGFIARVLTPNFDPLVAQACALLNVFPAIYDFAASQTFKPDFVPTPAVYYLHGQRSGFRLLNTEHECREHTEKLRPVFQEAQAGRPWIVVGYSGENDPVFDYVLAGRTFDYRLYWIGYRENQPKRHLTDHLLKEGSQAFYVPGFDADGFLVQLADRLGCFPPNLVSRPFTHLSTTFDLIGTYEHRDSEDKPVDLLGRARTLVEEAIKTLEKRPESAAGREKELLTEVAGRFMSGNYEDAVRLAEGGEERSEEMVELLIWSYNNWGSALVEQAKHAERDDAERLLRAATEKYAAAIEIKPDSHEALYNLGTALSEQAQRAEGDEAERLFRAAAEKYSAALEIKPDKYQALGNWGNALIAQARRTDDQKSARLLEKAEGLLQKALELSPADTYNLACLRAVQGRLEEARALLFEAKQSGTLPERAHLLDDPDLESVRELPWFEELLEKEE